MILGALLIFSASNSLPKFLFSKNSLWIGLLLAEKTVSDSDMFLNSSIIAARAFINEMLMPDLLLLYLIQLNLAERLKAKKKSGQISFIC